MSQSYVLARYEGPDGGRSPIWEVRREVVMRFIREMGLEPIPMERLGPTATAEVKWDRNIYGGWRVPHLHFGQDIYLMDPEQWHKFSSARLREFGELLTSASTVSFQHFMEVGEAVVAATPIPLAHTG